MDGEVKSIVDLPEVEKIKEEGSEKRVFSKVDEILNKLLEEPRKRTRLNSEIETSQVVRLTENESRDDVTEENAASGQSEGIMREMREEGRQGGICSEDKTEEIHEKIEKVCRNEMDVTAENERLKRKCEELSANLDSANTQMKNMKERLEVAADDLSLAEEVASRWESKCQKATREAARSLAAAKQAEEMLEAKQSDIAHNEEMRQQQRQLNEEGEKAAAEINRLNTRVAQLEKERLAGWKKDGPQRSLLLGATREATQVTIRSSSKVLQESPVVGGIRRLQGRLNIEMEASNVEIEKLSALLNAERERVAELEERAKQMRGHNVRLQTELLQLREQEVEPESTQNELDDLNSLLKEANDMEEEKKREDNDHVQLQLAQALEEKESVQQEFDRLTTLLNSEKDRVVEIEKREEKIQERNFLLLKELRRLKSKLLHNADYLDTLLSGERERVESIREKEKKWKEEIDRLEKKLKQHQLRDGDYEKLKQNERALTNSLNAEKQRVAEIEEREKKMEENNNRLMRELEQVESERRQQQQQEWKKDNDRLQLQLAQAVAEKESVQQEFERVTAELDKEKSRVFKMEEMEEKMRENNDRLEKVLQQLVLREDAAKESIQNELETAKISLSLEKGRVAELEEREKQMREDNDRLEKELQQLQLQLSQEAAEKESVRREFDKLTTLLHAEKDRMMEIEKREEAMREKNDSLLGEMRQLESKLLLQHQGHLEKLRTEERERLESIREKEKKWKEEIDRLEKRLKQSGVAYEKLEQNERDLANRLDTEKTRAEEIEEREKKMQEKNYRLVKELQQVQLEWQQQHQSQQCSIDKLTSSLKEARQREADVEERERVLDTMRNESVALKMDLFRVEQQLEREVAEKKQIQADFGVFRYKSAAEKSRNPSLEELQQLEQRLVAAEHAAEMAAAEAATAASMREGIDLLHPVLSHLSMFTQWKSVGSMPPYRGPFETIVERLKCSIVLSMKSMNSLNESLTKKSEECAKLRNDGIKPLSRELESLETEVKKEESADRDEIEFIKIVKASKTETSDAVTSSVEKTPVDMVTSFASPTTMTSSTMTTSPSTPESPSAPLAIELVLSRYNSHVNSSKNNS